MRDGFVSGYGNFALQGIYFCEFHVLLLTLIYDIVPFSKLFCCLFLGGLVIEVDFQHALVKFPVMDDADIFNADMVHGQYGGNGGNGTRLVNNITVEGIFLLDKIGRASCRERVFRAV